MQEAQVMFGLSGPGIIVIGYVIAILLVVIGFREKGDFQRRSRYIRSGGILFGTIFIVGGLMVYGYLVALQAYTMTLQGVIILTLNSSIGGLIIGISGCYPMKQ
ncbi:MAG: hypothetical protein ACFFCP_07130 [Promethearchaeota archaeon]